MAKILVVEDSDPIAELIEMVLKPRGHELLRDSGGDQAVKLASEFKPDLILLDVTLPLLDGYTIQTQLLESELTRGIPIVVMTSKSSLEDMFQTADNVKSFIAKPFTVNQLLLAIDQILLKK